jgi:hypothetical protein
MTPAQTSNLLLADASPPSRRRELKADVWSSLSPRASRDPISDSPIGLFSSLRTNVAPEPQGYYNPPMARIDPHNRIGTGGEDLLSNNFNWNLPLLGLGGRGLDLGLTLSYNSLVWALSGNYIDFDVDAGSMAPGFRLGFPTVEGPYWNDQAATYFGSVLSVRCWSGLYFFLPMAMRCRTGKAIRPPTNVPIREAVITGSVGEP